MNEGIHLRSEMPYFDVVGRQDDFAKMEDTIRAIFKANDYKPAKGFYKDENGLRILYHKPYGDKYSITEFPVLMDAESIIPIVKTFLITEKYQGKKSSGDGSNSEGFQIVAEEMEYAEVFTVRKVNLYYGK